MSSKYKSDSNTLLLKTEETVSVVFIVASKISFFYIINPYFPISAGGSIKT